MKLSEETIRDLLDRWPVARLASIGPSGQPHQVPIVFARVGEWLWSPVDGKPKSERELTRVRNVRERPQVSLLLDEYSSDWTQLWWIRIEATGRVVRPTAPNRDAIVAVALDALREKYPQYGEVPLVRDPPTLLAFRSTRIRSWCASPNSG